MFKIGCHLSISKGLAAMGRDALSVGANVFQFFCRNPRGRGQVKFGVQDIEDLKELLAANDIGPILIHSPFVINPASVEPQVLETTREVMQQDLEFAGIFPHAMYNFHPGNYLKRTPQEGIENIASTLDFLIKPGQSNWILLETMAGKGTELGRTFEELRAIIDLVEYSEHLGVCLDTCHVWDGGYDIVGDLDGVLREFDGVIGLDKLKAIHLNDSLNVLGKHKDRHAKIGEGNIGLEGLGNIINHPVLRDLPFYLETPNELPGYAQEIEVLRGLFKESL